MMTTPIYCSKHGITFEQDWTQGRAVYGGLTGAVLLQACLDAHPLPPRSCMISFVGPVTAGPAEVTTRTLRVGKSVSHVLAEIVQESETRVTGLFALGDSRKTGLHIAPPSRVFDPPDSGLPLTYMEGITPIFIKNFEFRFLGNSLPFSGTDAKLMGWVRASSSAAFAPEEPELPGSFTPLLLALLDAWPPPIWSALTSPAPGSTLTWNVNFMPPAFSKQDPGSWFAYSSNTLASGEGYAVFEAHLYDADGRLLAITSQAFAEFSPPV